ncbi:MAG: hypothetical protein MI861_13220, partial [Pirellulales bacterium]|nr:hypothetical protein [Pirellulales bacterium]
SLDNSPETIPLLAADMNAVLQQLLQMPEIDKDRIGLFGVSQANWYLPIVAENETEQTNRSAFEWGLPTLQVIGRLRSGS